MKKSYIVIQQNASNLVKIDIFGYMQKSNALLSQFINGKCTK